MSFTTVGDLARTLLIQTSTSKAKANVNKLTQEFSTGLLADPAAALRGNLTPMTGLEATLGRLKGWKIVQDGLSTQMTSMQKVLASLRTLGEETTKEYMLATQPNAIKIAAEGAAANFDHALKQLNSKIEDRSLFAGINSDSPATAPSSVILDALEQEIAGLTSPEDVAARVQSWFQSPTGFAAVGYTGGASAAPISIAENEKLAIGITGNDPALQNLLAGLALGALIHRGTFEGGQGAQTQLMTKGTEILAQGAVDLAYLAGRLGQSEDRLARAQASNLAEKTTLEIERTRTLSAEPEETAAALTQITAQLELIYAMTARLSSLSLLNALK